MRARWQHSDACAVQPDPGVAAITRAATWLYQAGGQRLQVPKHSPCFVRIPFEPAAHSRSVVAAEVFEPAVKPWRRANHRPHQHTGILDLRQVRVDRGCAYVNTSAPLFVRPPCADDVVSLQGRDCALTAAVLCLVQQDPAHIMAMLHDAGDGTVYVRLYAHDDGTATFVPRWIRVTKSVPQAHLKAGAALWWMLLHKAVAVHGWDSTPPSHAQHCPGVSCAWVMQRLTGEPASWSYIDPNNAAFMLWFMQRSPSQCAAFRDAMPPRNAAIWAMFVQAHGTLCDDLAAAFSWKNPWTVADLDSFLQRQGLGKTADDDATRRHVCAVVALHMQQGQDPKVQDAALKQWLTYVCQTKLQAKKLVCFSTRPRFSRTFEPCVSRLADTAMGLHLAGYTHQVYHRQARAGLLAEHCYAVTGLRTHDGTTQLRVCDPTGRLGRRYTHCLGERVSLPSRHRTFWIDLKDVVRYAVGLYVSH